MCHLGHSVNIYHKLEVDMLDQRTQNLNLKTET